MHSLSKLAVVAAFTLSAFPAWATPFSASPPDVPGPLDGGSVTHIIGSPGASAVGGATLTFDLNGFASVDGSNCCTDTFTLTVNGATLFIGGFDMGGGGSNFVTFIDPGVTIVSTASFGFFGGGLTKFSVAHTLLSGVNTYLFDYGVMQGLGDEGWGLTNVVISADVSDTHTGVPEPMTLSLLGAGLAGIGAMRRRRAQAS